MKKTIIWLLISLSVPTPGQSQAVKIEKTGKGSPILFLPGFITPGSVWDETVKNLKGKHETHLVSYAGFNGNTPIPMPWYTTIKKELLDYITANQLSHIILVGHSMGGNLVVDIASEINSKVDRVIIVDALACMRELMMPGVPAEALKYESPYNKQMLEMNVEAFDQTADMMAQGMASEPDKQALIKSWILEADRNTFVYGYTDLLKLDLRPVLANIKVPVLILGAPFPSKEVVLPNFEKQYANLANKRIEIAPGGKHFIMYDQPDWLYNQINTFLAK